MSESGSRRDTIAAIATAGGRAGIGIVRVSGPACEAVASALLGRIPAPREARFGGFLDAAGRPIDHGIALFFPAPGSYTGEDVLELHAHGSRPVLEMLVERILESGARAARPGEFTERAFLEGRLDLAQAEAVADLIDAGSRQAARAASATLGGAFSRRVNELAARLINLRVQLEAGLDFADEDIDQDDDQEIALLLDGLATRLSATIAAANRGARLRDGMRVVLIGAPNVGKSSILNRLAEAERAIVTATPGTTRDLLRESVRIGDVQLELIDTAGLHDSRDEIEREGMTRARGQAATADLVLVVSTPQQGETDIAFLDGLVDVLRVRNKIDLSCEHAGDYDGVIHISAVTGDGFGPLRRAIAARAADHLGDGEFSARQRHVHSLTAAAGAVDAARENHQRGVGAELVAEELRRAQLALGEITGVVSSDDMLGAIFSTFCIGK